MTTDQLPCSLLLHDLIASGTWTGDKWLGADVARRVSPDENVIRLMAPPFLTIADEIRDASRWQLEERWWLEELPNVGEIAYEKALIIADFGPGCDLPVILYHEPMAEPVVMHLEWSEVDRKLSWCQSHRSFEAFARDVGLVDGGV